MIINAEKQQGQIVWAKISKKSKLWAAMIISTKKMNLAYFEDQPGKTCVWWFGNDTMSQLRNNLIFEFKSEIKNGMSNLCGQREEGVKQAIKILSLQFNFEIPKCNDRSINQINWALLNLPFIMKGTRNKNKELVIPDNFLNKIIMTNNNIKRLIEENKKKDDESSREEIRKVESSDISKMKNQYCMACRIISDELEIKHPIFNGFLCNDCFTKGKDIIISIAKDNANDGCCVCLTQKHTLVLCSFCIRAYCNECLEFYCDKKVLAKILADKTWKCFACLNTTILKTCRLVPRKTVDQLKNIYNLYPASTENNCIKEEIQEIHVLNYKDIQNNVPKALKNLEFPFKILEISYVNGDMLDNNKRNAKLVIQYYPNRENYNEDKFFDMNDCMKKFFSFLQIKNKMEALHGDRTIFWAFETSAAIKVSEQKIISRFIQTQPIIFGTNIDDVRQRSRFIWTNITILKDDIEEYTGQQIYLHQLPKYAGKRVKYNEDHKDMPWCYTSVHIILSNFIKNNVHRCK
ncbi:DNA (cytosine-5)-methyltransferase 3B-like isoform X1 [Rhopalosiphum padi]|uniref:DNA (cytosine-5)-methyltransferase 3B-like isoform X1 n=1 Tax=Rhopalosiphum padi TaxID=40932 RepID=UPI00298DD326|nr:DNA (cytosine-5)-methyltransferase 3B-like isoform X1 [Rhopalosiphum padi]